MSENKNEEIFFLIMRIALAGIFLWAALTKTFGFGFTETAENRWLFGLAGNSPTFGFLTFATEQSPLHGFFKAIAGKWFTDWLFMVALYGIGISLVLGIGRKIAGYGGALLMLMMWIAAPPWADSTTSHNPIFDDHIVYAAVLLFFANARNIGWKLAAWDQIASQYPFLE